MSVNVDVPVKIGSCEREHPIDEIPQVVQQLSVVLQRKIGPAEDAVLCFWSHIQQIEAVYISRYASLLCVVAKDTHSSTL